MQLAHASGSSWTTGQLQHPSIMVRRCVKETAKIAIARESSVQAHPCHEKQASLVQGKMLLSSDERRRHFLEHIWLRRSVIEYTASRTLHAGSEAGVPERLDADSVESCAVVVQGIST
jgi:hypothetical protein